MKTKTKKSVKNNNTKLSYSKQQIILIILCVYSAILGLMVFAIGYCTFYLWPNNDAENQTRMSITKAIDDLSTPAIIDAESGNIYFTQSKLTLPSAKQDTHLSSNIKYYYETDPDSSPTQLHIVDSLGFGNANDELLMGTPTLQKVYDVAVPKLQACHRGYTVVFNTPLSERADELKFNKQLQDGRTVYVYHDSACMFNDEKFDNYLKQIDSY